MGTMGRPGLIRDESTRATWRNELRSSSSSMAHCERREVLFHTRGSASLSIILRQYVLGAYASTNYPSIMHFAYAIITFLCDTLQGKIYFSRTTVHMHNKRDA